MPAQTGLSVGYGLTEAFAMVLSTPFEDGLRKIKAVGKCLPTVVAKVIDDGGREVPTRAIGEIVLRGAKVFKGHWKNPEATKALSWMAGFIQGISVRLVMKVLFIYWTVRKI